MECNLHTIRRRRKKPFFSIQIIVTFWRVMLKHNLLAHFPNILAMMKITIAPKMPPPPKRYTREYPAAAMGNKNSVSMIFLLRFNPNLARRNYRKEMLKEKRHSHWRAFNSVVECRKQMVISVVPSLADSDEKLL
jgi:hypothetical protein